MLYNFTAVTCFKEKILSTYCQQLPSNGNCETMVTWPISNIKFGLLRWGPWPNGSPLLNIVTRLICFVLFCLSIIFVLFQVADFALNLFPVGGIQLTAWTVTIACCTWWKDTHDCTCQMYFLNRFPKIAANSVWAEGWPSHFGVPMNSKNTFPRIIPLNCVCSKLSYYYVQN